MISVNYYEVRVTDEITKEEATFRFANLTDAQEFCKHHRHFRVSHRKTFDVCESMEEAAKYKTGYQIARALAKLTPYERKILGYDLPERVEPGIVADVMASRFSDK